KQLTPAEVERTGAGKIFYASAAGWLAIALKATHLAQEINLGAKLVQRQVGTSTPQCHSARIFLSAWDNVRISIYPGTQEDYHENAVAQASSLPADIFIVMGVPMHMANSSGMTVLGCGADFGT
ncbi:MAG: hypothetical protein ONB49_18695, partial [candidate division KSB1 bacterium]|nr:hypothetical protein [candidate division KSB1 bacterium]